MKVSCFIQLEGLQAPNSYHYETGKTQNVPKMVYGKNGQFQPQQQYHHHQQQQQQQQQNYQRGGQTRFFSTTTIPYLPMLFDLDENEADRNPVWHVSIKQLYKEKANNW